MGVLVEGGFRDRVSEMLPSFFSYCSEMCNMLLSISISMIISSKIFFLVVFRELAELIMFLSVGVLWFLYGIYLVYIPLINYITFWFCSFYERWQSSCSIIDDIGISGVSENFISRHLLSWLLGGVVTKVSHPFGTNVWYNYYNSIDVHPQIIS